MPSLFRAIPADSFVLLEDVDAAFAQRHASEDLRITLSGLLNAIDGVAAKDGLALVRAGRIDVRVEFANATLGQMEVLFRRFFPKFALGRGFRRAHFRPVRFRSRRCKSFFWSGVMTKRRRWTISPGGLRRLHLACVIKIRKEMGYRARRKPGPATFSSFEALRRASVEVSHMPGTFIVARNPEVDSSLPFLVYLPFEGGTWLKARETWPRSSRVYCHVVEGIEVAALEIIERTRVVSCERRGPVLDLILDRVQNRRAQFLFTQARGRSMIFWQTAKSIANARPGLRVPQRPARIVERIAIDTRERYGYGFKAQDVAVERVALRSGDYAAFIGDEAIAIVERKTMDDFCRSLVDGTLGFAMGELAPLGTTAVVVEGTYAQLLRRGFVDGAWLGELMVRLQVRYPTVPIVFVETRALGERWTFAFFGAAATERLVGAPMLSALVLPDAPKKRRAPRRSKDAPLLS